VNIGKKEVKELRAGVSSRTPLPSTSRFFFLRKILRAISFTRIN